MAFLALGINHKTASVDVRERVAFTPEQLVEALQQLCRHTDSREAAILSTCNRSELYIEQDHLSADSVLKWLADYHHLSLEELRACAYVHEDDAAVRHMMRVASGLDSLVLGEPQILGQMKSAYAVAREAGTVGPLLGRLFQATFNSAKQVRTDTAIGENPVSVAFAAVSLAKQIFSDLQRSQALLIGAGETITLVARHLHELAVKLHAVLLADGKKLEADKFAESWIKDHAKDMQFRVYLAESANNRKDYAAASKYYRALVDAQPDNAAMLNNLAWSLDQIKDPKAIEYAEKAYKLAPEQPAVMDTLGVMLVERGDAARGLELLKKASSKAPQNGLIRLNLAKALVKAGNKDEAKKELEELAKLGEKFPAQAEVEKLRQGL